MSATYTLHVAPHAFQGEPEALDRADLVRDGFAWGAFLVPALWFARHRHWLLALGALAAVGGLGAGLGAAGASVGTIVATEFLLHLLIGLEGSTLRRWAYARRGRPVADIVVAANLAEAETKSFARWLAPYGSSAPFVGAHPRAAPPPVPGAAPRRREPEPIIGLFPDLEGRRT